MRYATGRKTTTSMGGDGGTKAICRSYLRGAGSASTTGDGVGDKNKIQKDIERQETSNTMRLCSLTETPLFDPPLPALVVCPYGKLYKKEAAIADLLKRKTGDSSDLGKHIRGLKDLHDVHFELATNRNNKEMVPVCPVTGRQLNGQIPAHVLLPSGTVLSEYAIKQLGEKAIQEEYNSTSRIRLAPPPNVLLEIQQQLQEQRAKKKRKRHQSERKQKSKKKESLEG